MNNKLLIELMDIKISIAIYEQKKASYMLHDLVKREKELIDLLIGDDDVKY